MDRFNDNEYADLIGNLLHDIHYSQISNAGKIAGLRRQAEVLVRKILDIGSSRQLTLGQIKRRLKDPDIKKRLESLGDELSEKLIITVEKIRELGNKASHTQYIEEFSDKEIACVEDSILDLYALLFIRFFLNIQVSLYSPPRVLRLFSLLPPIIRYKTWKYLFEKDKNNIQVVNRLCLSIIKVYDKRTAYQWINENCELIRAIPYPTKPEIEKYNLTNAIEVNPGIYLSCVDMDFDSYNNVYDLLYAKISDPRTSVNEAGKMYKSFEDAKGIYCEERTFLFDGSKEVTELQLLMDFVYLGRESNRELFN